MKHFIVLTAVLLLFSISAGAQVHLGIDAGWNASVLSGQEGVSGPSARVLVHWRLSADRPVFIQGGLSYSHLTTRQDTGGLYTKYETRIPTLSFPVMVGYEAAGGKFRIGGGVEVGRVLSQTLSYAFEASATALAAESGTKEIRDFNPSRSRLLAGIEYLMLPWLGVRAMYCCGIPYSNRTYVADSADYVSQHNYVQLGLTLYLL